MTTSWYNKLNAWSLTPWATKTSWMQQIPTTVIPCSLHNVAAATRTTVRAMGAHTAKRKEKALKTLKIYHVFYATLINAPWVLQSVKATVFVVAAAAEKTRVSSFICFRERLLLPQTFIRWKQNLQGTTSSSGEIICLCFTTVTKHLLEDTFILYMAQYWGWGSADRYTAGTSTRLCSRPGFDPPLAWWNGANTDLTANYNSATTMYTNTNWTNQSEASEDYRLELDRNPSISDAADGWKTLCLE